jgi:DNA-binding GntR family transcriptional regulator
LPHARIAEIIGASRITVTRTIARLRRAGVVTDSRGVVTVVSRDELMCRLDELP